MEALFSSARRRWLGLALLGTLFCLPARLAHPADTPEAPAAHTIFYGIRLAQDDLHLLVSMRFHVPDKTDHVLVQMPAWSPGDYRLQRHARYVEDLIATDAASHRLVAARADQNTWEIRPAGAQEILVQYALPKTPAGLFSENVSLSHRCTFLNGPATFLYVVGRKSDPVSLTIARPPGWRVEVALAGEGSTASGAVVFAAPDYDTLADSPVVFAASDALQTRDFLVRGILHRAVFFGDLDSLRDPDAYTPVLKQIVQAETQIMGSVPYARYRFFFDVNGRSGGLEHLNSCRIGLASDDDPRRLAPFFAHEFYHLWNVKRIRPHLLGPFDYLHPPHTRNLWFAEGVTEYYAHVASRRAGILTEEGFLTHWQQAIRRLQRNPARLKITAEEASLRVWEEGQSQGYGGLSYYDKGELIGLCLDLKLRQITENRRSLDDVMRLLMQRCSPPKPGYEEDGLCEAVNAVAGQDLTAYYNLLARSTQEMPFAECLAYAGLDVNGKPLPNATPAQRALRKSWTEALPMADPGAPDGF